MFGRVGWEQERTKENDLLEANESAQGGFQLSPYSTAVIALGAHDPDDCGSSSCKGTHFSFWGFVSTSAFVPWLLSWLLFVHNYIPNVNAYGNDP